ncbi:unnamed protein product [Hymenolepis diminuta]|uniref:Uncharacterized protein n=1 Tax=Hymenolepis diminuta TaxID=6216 RepID=A0A564YQ53_HYMDI|nr:unnamed protein product [Hymenolepis diminuta]
MDRPLPYPASRHQNIHRIPVYLPVEATKVSYSPNGSWRNISVDSKSASISSGYGTPKALPEDGCYRHRSSQSGFASSEAANMCYLERGGSNGNSDTLVEDDIWPEKKRSYNAIKHKPVDVWRKYSRVNAVPLNSHFPDVNLPMPPHLCEARRHPIGENMWFCEKHHQPPPYANRRHIPDGGMHYHDYIPEYRHYECHQNDSRHSTYLCSSSDESWKDYDEAYSPVEPNYLPSSNYLRSNKWKSEANLFVSTLDEEATQIYNEILDVASSLAYEEQRIKASEKRPSDVAHDQRKLQHRYKSLYNLQGISPGKESFEKVTPRPFPRLLDRRRSRRSDYERTPTNISSPWLLTDYKNENLRRTFDHTPDSDAESALEALDNAVNFGFLKPAPTRRSRKRKSLGPTPIIREYIGETEEDWLKLQARNQNGRESPTEYSVIEIDDIRGDEDTRRTVVQPSDDVERKLLTPIHSLHIVTPNQNSGNFSVLTPTEDSSYMSDIDI